MATHLTIKQHLELKVAADFHNVDTLVREDLYYAIIWAREMLRAREGVDITFDLTTKNDMFSCSFAHHTWAGDHSGRYTHTAPEAIVMAVCEYINGM